MIAETVVEFEKVASSVEDIHYNLSFCSHLRLYKRRRRTQKGGLQIAARLTNVCTMNQPVLTKPAATPLMVSNTSVTKSSDGSSVSLNF
ncbi:hypothetical protein J14TS2_08470 [Bacillus sp. J14TS2]|nr:hypothetical protein J14TS2_08470 [Bacillus sp. J14TS2]